MWSGRTIKEVHPFKLLRSFTQKSPRNSYALELRPDQWNRMEKASHLLPYGVSGSTSKVVMNRFPGCRGFRSQIYCMTDMEHLKGWGFKGRAETCISEWKCSPVTGVRQSCWFQETTDYTTHYSELGSLKICFLLKFSAVLNWGLGIMLICTESERYSLRDKPPVLRVICVVVLFYSITYIVYYALFVVSFGSQS